MEHIFIFKVADMPGKTYSIHFTDAANLSDQDLLHQAHLVERYFRYDDHKLEILAIASRSDLQTTTEPARLRYTDERNKEEAEREMKKELADSQEHQSNRCQLNLPEKTEYLFLIKFVGRASKLIGLHDRSNLSKEEILSRGHEIEVLLGSPEHEAKTFAVWIYSDYMVPDKTWQLIYVDGYFRKEMFDEEERVRCQNH